MASFWLATGLPLSVAVLLPMALETALRPAPAAPWRRPPQALLLHAGLWVLAYAVLLLALRRPWFACVLAGGLAVLLTLVNNAKHRALREAFICQDFEYFTDMLRHPRLYLPFFGLWRAAAGLALFVLAMAAGLLLEPPWTAAGPARAFWLGAAGWAGLGLALLALGSRRPLALAFEPDADVRQAGFYAALWAYGWAEMRPPAQGWPLTRWTQAQAGALPAAPAPQPDLVVVQSESFFDARRLHAGIKPGVLAQFDALRGQALCHGRLRVPSWGANTVRTEFAFLSGLDEPALGVHRFNPYRKLARMGIVTLAAHLRAQGYRTVCVHPYPAAFYRRARSYPWLGFDEFLDIRAFADAAAPGGPGPYVPDVAVAQRVRELLRRTGRDEGGQALFVFVITMENHGPLHLERMAPAEQAGLYDMPPPAGCGELGIYLRHLRNADRMLAMLRQALAESARPGVLAFYGDHVPIMPQVYAALGEPDGRTDYLVWRTPGPAGAAAPAAPPESAAPAQSSEPVELPAWALGERIVAALSPGQAHTPLSPAPAGGPAPGLSLRYPLPAGQGPAQAALMRLVASGRSFLFGRGPLRQRLLGPRLDRGRIVAAYRDGVPVGFLSFSTPGRGPYSLAWRDFAQVFGAMAGTARYAAFCLISRRERRYRFYVYSLRVAPEARRQGVGAALLAEAERQARLLGASAVDAEVFASNERSMGLFASQGYRPVRRIALWGLGRWLPAASMVWLRKTL
ncbi:GNAT family N-acetyltransferase [Orrella sp. JC864]|uniref:GNAT family N-acetyltransferase n=1 Tax=Orrella sp. JC864 TaxID=3120298 RepID=UPI00300A7B5F